MPDELLTVAQAAAELGISPGRLRSLVADGTVPSIKPGHDRLIRAADLAPHRQRPKRGPKPKQRPA